MDFEKPKLAHHESKLILGYSQLRLKELNKEFERRTIHSQASEHTTEDISHSDILLGTEKVKDLKAGLKTEINRMAGYFLGPIWQSVKSWKKENKAELALWNKSSNPKAKLYPLQEAKFMLITQDYKTVEDIENQVQVFARYPMQYFINEWDRSQNESGVNEAYNRFKELLNLRTSISPSLPKTPEDQLQGAFLEGDNVAWRMMKAIPRLLEQHFSRMPTREEIENTLKNTKPLALTLAGSNAAILNFINLELTNSRTPDESTLKSQYDIKKLLISQRGNKYALEIAPPVFDAILKHLTYEYFGKNIGSITTGCSGLITKGFEGKSMIYEFYDDQRKVYEKFIVPQLLSGEKPWDKEPGS